MLEKSSSIVLTEEDIRLYNTGIVSERVKALWGLTLEELRIFFDNNSVTILGSDANQGNNNEF